MCAMTHVILFHQYIKPRVVSKCCSHASLILSILTLNIDKVNKVSLLTFEPEVTQVPNHQMHQMHPMPMRSS